MKHKSSFVSVLAIAFLDNFGLSLVFILFAPLILNPQYGFVPSTWSEGAKNLLLGLLIGAFPLFTFFGAPLWGDIGDRLGRKKAFIYTILGTLFGHLISAFSIYAENLTFLLLSRIIAGFFSGNISLCMATVTDLSGTSKKRAHNFGLLTVSMGLGWISAMLIGGILSDPTISSYFSPVLPFFIVAALTFMGYLLIQFYFVETHPPQKTIHFDLIKSFHDLKEALHIQAIRPFLLILLIWSIGWFFTFQWFAPISLEKYQSSQSLISLYLSLLGICWIIGGLLINSLLVKWFSSKALAFYSILFCSLFVFLSGIASQYFFFGLFFWATALAAPVSLSNLLNVVSISAPRSIQGKAMGFTQSIQALAAIIVPLVGGELANLSISSIFPISAALLLCSSIYLKVRGSPGPS